MTIPIIIIRETKGLQFYDKNIIFISRLLKRSRKRQLNTLCSLLYGNLQLYSSMKPVAINKDS